MNYYADQLRNISNNSSPLKLKVHSTSGETKWLNINLGSIPAIIKYLEKVNKELITDKRKEA